MSFFKTDIVRTHLIPGLLESTINVILGCPHSRNSLVVVPEALFKAGAQLREEALISGLLVDLGAQGEPRALAEARERERVLLVRAVEACC